MLSRSLETTKAAQEDIWTLQKTALFGHLGADTFDLLFRGQPVALAAKDAMLCHWGAPAETCFIVLKGIVKVFRLNETGESALLALHGPGRALMLAEGLTGKPYSASVQAISPARVMCLNVKILSELMAADAKLAMALLAAAAGDLRRLIVHLEELKAMTGPARLATLILNLSEQRAGTAEITLPYEKQLVANWLGMTPESFSRAMGQLKDHGLSVRRDHLIIANAERLRSFALTGR